MPLVRMPELIAATRSGGVVAFPTDTVPALAVLPDRGEKIYQLKQRPHHKPLILMAATWLELQNYVEGSHPEWDRVVAEYLPGALTIVLPARGESLNQTATIGVRIPHSLIALEVLQQTGALLTTSANKSGEPPIETITAIVENFPGVFGLDHEPHRVWGKGQPSTVIKWEQNHWQVLRQGDVHFPTNT